MTDLTEAKRALLAEWERRRDELNVLINALRKELGIASSESNSIKPVEMQATTAGALNVNDLVRPGDFFGMTQVDAMKAFLQRTNKQLATLQELAAALYRGKATDSLLEGAKLRNLSSLLSKTDDFITVARGRWGLAEWYPQRALDKAKKKANGDDPAAKVNEATAGGVK